VTGQSVDLSSPYKGLAAFEDTELDALLFFGRGRDTDMIAANLMASRFTILYGPLGVGKSSVLRAGVVRKLRAVASDARVVVSGSWAGDPEAELARSVAETLGVRPPEGDASLSEALAEMTSRQAGELYLVFDQFEELFVYPRAENFAAALADVVRAPYLRVNVLLALREDALSELDVFTGRIPNVFGNHLALEPLDRAAARDAILGPLARYNELSDHRVEIEPELAEAVLDEVEVGRVHLDGAVGAPSNGGVSRIETPYLQLVMQALWEAEKAARSSVLRLETFHSMGGAETIVRNHLDDAMTSLPDGDRDVAARIFNHLVTPSGTKISHGIDDLAEYAGVSQEDMAPVVRALGEHRILRPVDGRWEIFHDVLADPVLAWRARHEADQALERQREEARRRHRRLLALLIAAAIALAAMAAVTIYALAQRSNAREQASLARAEARSATANALSAEAGVLIPVTPPETDPELGLLLSAEAAKLEPTHRAADTLRRALLVSHLRAVLPDRRVTAASFSPDGERILVATHGGAVRVYSKEAQTRLAAFRAGAPVTTASFSPDGTEILTSVRDGPVTIRDAAGDQLATFGRRPTSASFAPDGSLVLTVEDGKSEVWKPGGSPVATLRARDPITSALFGPHGRLVVAFGDGPRAWVFDARSGESVAAVNQHSKVTSAAIVPRRDQLVTAGADGTARLWSLGGGGRLLHEMSGQGTLTAGEVAPDGRFLITTSTDTTARAWELPSGALLSDLIGHNNRVLGAAFSRDGKAFVTWSSDGTARVWDRGRGAARVILAGHGNPVTDATFDASGDTVLTRTAAGTARLWVSRVDSELQPLASIPRPIYAAVFSANGQAAAVAGAGGIEVLDPAGRQIASLPAHSVTALAIDGAGSAVAAATGRHVVSIWNLPGTQPVAAVTVPVTPSALALDAGASRLAIGSVNGQVRVWKAGQGSVTTLAGPEHPVTAIAFSPDGRRLAAGFANGTLSAWRLSDGGTLYRSSGHAPGTAVLSVGFSRIGERLVTAGADTTARVWDATSGRPLYTLRGHASPITDASFDPSGRWIVTAGRSVAGLWDRASRQRLLFLPGGEAHMFAASFDPSGLRIMAVGIDGKFRSYSCEVCAGIPGLLRLAERRLEATGRELTQAERARYSSPAAERRGP
jgi:WD40 repeat protein